jgi:hypothetical protein
MRSGHWVLTAVVLFAGGCGSGVDLPELGTVSGVVTLDGKPLPGVTVKFVPANGRTSSGFTDANGKYELVYNADNQGAEVGEHTVYVSGHGGESGGNPNEEGGGSGGPAVEYYKGTIPAKYNEKSTLKKTVGAGDNTIDLQLTSN